MNDNITKEEEVLTDNGNIKSKQKTKESLGILFVHGIGEQKKGETMLAFAEPLIIWLQRRAISKSSSINIDYVEIDGDTPSFTAISHKDSDKTILLKEAWWASRFKPPAFFELAWWLLLVGTWATFSHAIKPVVQHAKNQKKYPTIVAIFRALFYYTPVAICYQLVVFLIIVLAAIPIGPLREFFSELLLKLSRTLGDSFVLIHSPLQRNIAIDTVADEIKVMLKKCQKVIVVAHSQGAAISYYALEKIALSNSANRGDIEFISVGSGLDKLTDLEETSHAIEYRNANKKGIYNFTLYLLPSAFVVFWVLVGACLYLSKYSLAIIVALTLTVLFWCAIGFLYVSRNPSYHLDICKWTDIHASSDPVSNGKIKGSAGGHEINSQEIINERSLLKDHTSYFTNSSEFIPKLIESMARFSSIEWLNEMKLNQQEIKRSGLGLFFNRSRRKQSLMIGKWLNRIFYVVFVYYAHTNIDSIKGSVVKTFNLITDQEFISRGLEVLSSAYWFIGIVVFTIAALLTKWADFTADRTERILLFNESKSIGKVYALLTWVLLIGPVLVWGWFWFIGFPTILKLVTT